jgi:hypothetical protein
MRDDLPRFELQLLHVSPLRALFAEYEFSACAAVTLSGQRGRQRCEEGVTRARPFPVLQRDP